MAGTLIVNKRMTWMPAGWLYDFVLANASEHVRPEFPVLADVLKAATTDKSVGYLDLSALSSDEVRAILNATRKIAVQVSLDGPSALADPSFYEGLTARIAELVQGLEEDDRIAL